MEGLTPLTAWDAPLCLGTLRPGLWGRASLVCPLALALHTHTAHVPSGKGLCPQNRKALPGFGGPFLCASPTTPLLPTELPLLPACVGRADLTWIHRARARPSRASCAKTVT